MEKNRKIVFFAFSCILFVFFLAGCAKREIENIGSAGKNIICFGDSLTAGYGANPGEDYPSVLSSMVDIPVINAGVESETTTEALKRLESDVLNKEPLLVIIEFGGNDFLNKIPKEETFNNVKEMAERIQAKGAMAAIVDISAGTFLKEYRSLLSRLARQEKAIFIPSILSGIITNPSMKSDFLHPNAGGYKIIAQRIYNAIMPHLSRNAQLKR